MALCADRTILDAGRADGPMDQMMALVRLSDETGLDIVGVGDHLPLR
jgi:hypothetical protein